MIARRLLHLDTHRLTAYLWRRGQLTVEDVFAAHADDHQRFAAYLRACPASQFQLLANVSEEGFQTETIPFLRGRDRESVLRRKLGQHFFGTRLSAAVSLGFEKTARRDEKVLLTALTNAAQLQPWLTAIGEAEVSLAGVWSISQLGGRLLQAAMPLPERCLLLTLQDGSIRESFLVRGETLFSRMAPVSDSSVAGIAAAFAAEAGKLQQYLLAQRQIGRNETLPAIIVAHPQAAEAILASCLHTGNLDYRILDNRHLADRIGLAQPLPDSRSELLFLHLLASRPPRRQLADEPLRHDYRLQQIRQALIGVGAVSLFASALFAAKELYQAYALEDETRRLAYETAQLEQRYQEIAATFPPLPMDYPQLRDLTERLARLTAQRRFPDAGLQRVSQALDAAPAIELEGLEWAAAGPGQPPDAEVLKIQGSVRTGAHANPRQVLQAFDAFVQGLQASGGDARIVKPPIDLESGQALRGGDAESEGSQPRSFIVQVGYRSQP